MNQTIIPSEQQLIEFQQKLQKDSDWILEQIDLLSLLSKYGEVKIVGAKALGLMVAKDIDISVVVPKIDLVIWQEIVSQLMVTKHVRKVTAVDEYNYDENNVYDLEKGKKYSLYIEMDSVLGPDQDKNNLWEIQIHLITKDKFDERITKNLISKLNYTNRLTILRLKWWANKINRNLLFESNGHFKIQSIWIYEAVMHQNTTNIRTFIQFLQNKISNEDRHFLSIIQTTD
ncbi:hypothetical protein COX08_04405 [Candidatus Beckwithbacteria bacterium CG23_combo_of_CG06-09_8_20_14_all_34_8]|uniref:Polymerase nucleotidyl transferase domain-containing protein n=1 Tax=Candidatus Beckwithbacteria bacterium CG23_combo_of_CG06-09_8_20_14_all_34_8 TaxID=1974497 RepID=A0A2H0B572_9BACT|nr:MAG: hypothetical protein COX08_04405 [Candidatus Beckwithbacteria bacterium CG23_combo_of_CG06-09_8_20_14_all_34_8]